ncbi:MAG: GEVED domain-containing protein, partial [Bacteroidota bacterium]
DDNLIGTPCDDGDPCTEGELYDANCGCSGGIDVGDSDEDGVCDALDQCPNFDDNLIGMPCDDGDICTIGEIYDENCGCSDGQYVGDSDEDGVCDLEDQCPNFDDNLIGTPCDDGDPCTEGELYDANCGCSGGIDVGDSDEDGICDAQDQCPNFDDNLIGMPCDDGDICTVGEIYDENCGCSGGQYVGDSDEDGVCDLEDQCPNFDDNLIGTPCDDGDPCTEGEFYDANCGCSGGQYVGDSDQDGVCDAEDQCPNFDDNLIGIPCDDGDACTEGEIYDPNCGCSGGISLPDSDGDGLCDAIDECPDDPTNSCNSAYCEIAGNSTQYEYIDQVTFESIDNLSGDNSGYGDFTAQSTDIQKAHAYPITLVPGFVTGVYQEYWRVWIDMNGDGDFEDAGELIFEDNSNATIVGSLNIPAAGIEGETRMRVSMRYNGYSEVCGVFDWGEAEDYTVNLLPACIVGEPCDDGDACTTGEFYDENCDCVGGTEEENCDCPAYNWNENAVLAYDPGQDLGSHQILDDGNTLYMEGNSWKAIDIGYTVTPNTVISFDFKSTFEGEIHEVGFDNDLIVAPDHRIVVYGDQGYPGTFTNPVYSGSGDWESFTISLGNNFSGFYQYLVLTADDDATAEGNSYFRNVTIFEDMDGNLLCDEDSDCTMIFSDDFESGYGNWNDGGSDCFLYTGNSNSGERSVRIRDNSGSQSSLISDPMDLSPYASVLVNFTYLPNSMETNEDFFLEYSSDGGANYTLIQEWNSGLEFFNGIRYFENVLIEGVAFTSDARLRFRCDASGNGDQIYLDDIMVTGCVTAAATEESEMAETRNEMVTVEKEGRLSVEVYPNPARYVLNLKISNARFETGKIEVRTPLNQLVMQKNVEVDRNEQRITVPIGNLQTGTYFITYFDGNERVTKRFIALN